MNSAAITRWLTDGTDPRSMAARTRGRRWERLVRTFPDLRDMRVIDLGGLVGEWTRVPVRPAHVTVVNLFEQQSADGVEALIRDVCALSAPELGSFDLVFSNSVIDQLGGHERRTRFAELTDALAPQHWIQTAYRYFPIDAYTLFPLQQCLPLAARAYLTRHWPLGHRHTSDWQESVLDNLRMESLSVTAFAAYFPDSEILRERWGGLTKSLIAVRS